MGSAAVQASNCSRDANRYQCSHVALPATKSRRAARPQDTLTKLTCQGAPVCVPVVAPGVAANGLREGWGTAVSWVYEAGRR